MNPLTQWTFVKVKHPNIAGPKAYCWYLKITSTAQLVEYLTTRELGLIERGFNDLKKGICDGIHNANSMGNLMRRLILLTSGVDSVGRLFADATKAKFAILEQYGCLLINSVGGITWIHKDNEITEVAQRNIITFPNDKPRVVRWPGGKHYYIKCGTTDIGINGKYKWNTIRAAEAALKQFKETEKTS